MYVVLSFLTEKYLCLVGLIPLACRDVQDTWSYPSIQAASTLDMMAAT